jgi:glutamate-1-semialdehyde 2,1-aminomutase
MDGTLGSRAERVLAGGVSAGWNHHGSYGVQHFVSGTGALLTDVDGEEHIDFIVGWGSLMLGHDPAVIRTAVERSLSQGFGFQYETPAHVELAELLCGAIPCAEKMRLCNSGLEATLYALRLARAHTGRDKVVKFEGHFHGLQDYLLWDTDSSPRLGEIDANGEIASTAASAGIPSAIGEFVVSLPFNDPDVLADAVSRHRDSLAAVILEPVALNVGCIAPDPGYLEAVRQICSEAGVVLIFDEVLTGFRLGLGGAQERFGVTPDLACYSKAMSCGMPVAAVAGSAEIMDQLSPLGGVEMSGTNTGRRFAVDGTLAGLREMVAPGFFERVDELNDYLVAGLRRVLGERGVPAYVEGYGGRVGVFVGTEERPRTLRDICETWNAEYHLECYDRLRDSRMHGFMMPLAICPEAITICAVHTEAQLDEAFDRFDSVLATLPYREPVGRV